MLRRVRAVVRGRVQGVSFRWFTTREAERLGVRGWVRNNRDGSVELEAEGTAEAVAELLDYCRSGPPAAKVTALDVEDVAPGAGDVDFRVV